MANHSEARLFPSDAPCWCITDTWLGLPNTDGETYKEYSCLVAGATDHVILEQEGTFSVYKKIKATELNQISVSSFYDEHPPTLLRAMKMVFDHAGLLPARQG